MSDHSKSEQFTFTFEHAAFNVADKEAAIRWYRDHLGMQVLLDVPGDKAFLGDSTGRPVLEIYEKTSVPVLDFENTHFLSLHFAFVVSDPDAAAEKLVNAGAKIAEAAKDVDGDRMIMLTDPFGVAIQLLRRDKPL